MSIMGTILKAAWTQIVRRQISWDIWIRMLIWCVNFKIWYGTDSFDHHKDNMSKKTIKKDS